MEPWALMPYRGYWKWSIRYDPTCLQSFFCSHEYNGRTTSGMSIPRLSRIGVKFPGFMMLEALHRAGQKLRGGSRDDSKLDFASKHIMLLI